jgi:hypothetical protein
MISRDYTQEVGLKSGTPRIPWPLAVVALLLIAAGTGISIVKLLASAPPRAPHEAPAAPAPKPAHLAAHK